MLTSGRNYDAKCKVQNQKSNSKICLRVHITRFHSISRGVAIGGQRGLELPHFCERGATGTGAPTLVRGGQRGLEPPHFCERGATGTGAPTLVRGGQRGLELPHFCERGATGTGAPTLVRGGQNPGTICDNAFFFDFPYDHEIFVLFIYYPEYFILK